MISAEEYDRQRVLYEPLTAAIRKLIDAGIHTDIDEATAPRGAGRGRDGNGDAPAQEAHRDDPAPRGHGTPAGVGQSRCRGAQCDRPADEPGGRAWSEFTLSGAYEGPPGWVHGGICALVLDHILGEAASEGLTKPKFTGTIELRYLRGTPLGPLRAEAFIDRIDGVKTFARGYLSDAEGTTVEAEGVFIRPAWARDAG